MLEVLCCVRSTSKTRLPGPMKSVARPLGFSDQPGGTSIENPAAVLRASAAVTVCVDQSAAGSVVDGLLSAFTDWKVVVVSATEGIVAGVLPRLPVLPCWLSATAVPIPAATITAAASQMICHFRPRRPRPARPPPLPGAYCLDRSG